MKPNNKPAAALGVSASALAGVLAATPSPPTGVTRGLQPVVRQWGTVVNINTGPPANLTVTLGGSTVQITGVRYHSAYSPVANDTVMIDQVGTDLVVMGKLA